MNEAIAISGCSNDKDDSTIFHVLFGGLLAVAQADIWEPGRGGQYEFLLMTFSRFSYFHLAIYASKQKKKTALKELVFRGRRCLVIYFIYRFTHVHIEYKHILSLFKR